MLFYEGLSCPVCDKPFVEGDDVVFCPQCGLPHHRACWQMLGHCHAADRHNTDRQWSRDAQPTPPQNAERVPPVQEERPQGTYCEYKPFSHYEQPQPHFSDDEMIDGVRANDYAIVVGQKTEYYIPRFRRMAAGDLAGWNWAAFFFGAYWMIYRKMYIGGFLLLLLELFQTCITGFVLNQLNITDTQQLYDMLYNMLYIAPTMDKTQLFYLLSIWILSAIMLAINILVAVFANRLYQRHCAAVITKARQRVPDLRAPELMGIGGTSIGVVLISGILVSFIEQIISIVEYIGG